MSVEDPKEDIILFALLNGIQPEGGLMAELARKMPTRLEAFMDKSKEFMNGEETIKSLMQFKLERPKVVEKQRKDSRGERLPTRTKQRSITPRVSVKAEPPKNTSKAPKRAWTPIIEREFKWTPLNTSVS